MTLRKGFIISIFIAAQCFAAGKLSAQGMRDTIGSFNKNVIQCYEQTEKVYQGIAKAKLSTRPCSKIILSSTKSREAEANARHNRGIIYQYLDQQARAIKDFERAIKLDSSSVASYIALAQLHLKQENWVLAYKYFDAASLLDKSDKRLVANKQYAANKLQQAESNKNLTANVLLK
ncbi:tetratricopeptide repeat protein [Agaribacter marinus]|uniref:Tetratricopeptide repeat protein n=1 Tax=Agaribacter marinus TaxID=1431249 RepID=A0AA37T4C1_9ALTE|nr:tetratricopeptide repeat protein [Agaribacter marinus]GLR71783.1 hypothetical protein GCM10007852_26910 [Agaribacter marinus]